MRGSKMNGYIGEFKSSFLSCEKDLERIISKLFVESRPYSDELKRLLIINTPDCLRDKTNPAYIEKINSTSIADLYNQGYISFSPKLKMKENEDIKSYITISFCDFLPNEGNDYYRDCTIMIDILCHTDYWNLGNYQIRPLKIAGYIDGILNNTKLSGIGTLQFAGAEELSLGSSLSGYCLMYTATHGRDDMLEEEVDE